MKRKIRQREAASPSDSAGSSSAQTSKSTTIAAEVAVAAKLKVYAKKLQSMQTGDVICPLNTPGLPMLPANSAFLKHVQDLGDTAARLVETEVTTADGKKKKQTILQPSDQLYELVLAALRRPGFTLQVEVGPHRTREVMFLPGQLWGGVPCSGPRRADVMLIGKTPSIDEERAERLFVGPDGVLLQKLFSQLKCDDFTGFYVTNLVKFVPPDNKSVLKAAWIKDGLHLLYQELKIVQPRFILCLGADASKALLNTSASVSELEGCVESLRYNVGLSAADAESYWKEAKVVTVLNPRAALRDQTSIRQLEQGLARFVATVRGLPVGDAEKVQHHVVDSHADLLCALCDIEKKLQSRVIAVDAEWHGDHPVNANSYMRSMQLSWAPRHALGIKLHEPGGDVAAGFTDECFPESNTSRGILKKTIQLLCLFFKGGEIEVAPGVTVKFRRKRVVGHFFNADLEWLVAYGIAIQDCFLVPLHDHVITQENAETPLSKLYRGEGFKLGDAVPAWYRTKFEGGADTGLMAHAIEETANFKLEVLAMRYTSAPRYDRQLAKWKTEYCQSEGIKNKEMEGYGMCPDSILLPYGMYDADVTLRLFYAFDSLLDEDHEGNNCREAFWESQIATPAVLEIHQTGITVDRNRVDFLTTRFIAAKTKLEEKLRLEISWPEFNIRSTQHVREFLYGHKLNGRLDKITGRAVRIRPAKAISLNLMPLFDTSKPPKPWSEIRQRQREHDHSPSTNKQVLSLLAQEANPEPEGRLVRSLRDYRFLDQVLKTILRVPIEDEETEEPVFDEDGNFEYADGLASCVCDDGKVRTHIYQVKETGRWSSARPALQNISKQRDPDYKRLLGDEYKYSLRSVLKASPGHVLVEADYVGAELFGMAVMSGDALMIEHAKRNQLPEHDSAYYDIHSNIAVSAFRLDCEPTKSGLAAIGKKHLRIIAKSVIFGIAYGRGAKAIAVAAKEQGIDISVDEAQSVIDAIFNMYPHLQPFFRECQQRADGSFFDAVTRQPIRYLCNCFGRFRRFPPAGADRSLASEFGRQAMNFPIQSMIASAVQRGLAYLMNYKRKSNIPNLFRVLLQIHDAVLLEVPFAHVRHVCEVALPRCMRDSVPIYPTNLAGIPLGNGPFYLGIETEVMLHWGESLSHQQAESLGLPTGVGGTLGSVVNYSKPQEVKPQRTIALTTPARTAIPPENQKKDRG